MSGAESVLGSEAAARCAGSFTAARSRFGERPASGFRRVWASDPVTGLEDSVPLYLGGTIAPTGSFRVLAEGQAADNDRVPLVVECDGEALLLFDLVATIDDHLGERYLEPKKPLTTRLPFKYRAVPGKLRHALHAGLVRGRRLRNPGSMQGTWPGWPAVAILVDLAKRVADTAPEEPNVDLGPLWVTHDVDDADGLPLANALAKLEQGLGVRATFFVPAELIRAQRSEVEALATLGHAIGLHGLRHDNRQLLMPPEQYLAEVEGYAAELDALQVRAYRAPSLLTSLGLRKALARRFSIDSSLPDTDVYSEIGDHRGCGHTRPFVIEDGLTEVPITLALDDRLFTLHGQDANAALDAWSEKLAWLRARNGLPVLCTHTQPGMYRKLDAERLVARVLALMLDQG